MFRFPLALFLIASYSFSQNFPALRWVQQLDNLGTDNLVGIGTDAQGNIYLAGSTASPHFPVKSAAQSQLGTSGILRIDGATYTRLSSDRLLANLAVDPQNQISFSPASRDPLSRASTAEIPGPLCPFPAPPSRNS